MLWWGWLLLEYGLIPRNGFLGPNERLTGVAALGVGNESLESLPGGMSGAWSTNFLPLQRSLIQETESELQRQPKRIAGSVAWIRKDFESPAFDSKSMLPEQSLERVVDIGRAGRRRKENVQVPAP